MRILVLGAGVVGTTTAWYLRAAGHAVTVIERQAAAGLETSFANGGQISVSHAEPWANPHVFSHLLQWFGKPDAPLRLHRRWDPAFFRWGLAFLGQCWPHQTEQNIRAIVTLALYSRAALQALRQDLALAYDQRTAGILHIYADQAEWSRAQAASDVMNRFGLDRQTVDVEQCLAIEPALSAVRGQLVGGDYTASDESGDAHRFTQQLAARALEAGVEFLYGSTIQALVRRGERVTGVTVQHENGRAENYSADAVVMCLGPESAGLAASVGIYLPIYPAKGYSATLHLPEGCVAPTVSLTDDAHKIVFSRLGQRLRVAGTAEFNGYNRDLDPVRCAALLTRARAWFPEIPADIEPNYWCGLRPATPSNVPLIGGTGVPGLWVNSGHGTLGWTLACGSGRALAALISGEGAPVDFPFRRYSA